MNPSPSLSEWTVAQISVTHGRAASPLTSELSSRFKAVLPLKITFQPEIPAHLENLGNQILTAEFDTLIFVTGSGTRRILQYCLAKTPRERFLNGLADIRTIAATYQAAEALREFGVEPSHALSGSLDMPQSGDWWREVLEQVDRNANLVRHRIALEKTSDGRGAIAGLEARGAHVVLIPIIGDPVAEPPWPAYQTAWQQQSVDAIWFDGVEPVLGWLRMIRQLPDADRTFWLDVPILAGSPAVRETLRENGFSPSWTAPHDRTPEQQLDQLAEVFGQLQQQRATIQMSLSGPASSSLDPQAPWYNSPFMKACRGEPTEVTPIWMMRQAGRYMSEYREVRDKVSFLELCANPQLCSEVMCTAVSRLGVDAAIIFSDLLPILVPMGCDLEFVKGDGPVIHNPVRTTADIDRIVALESLDPLSFVMETVTQTRNDLPADMPLIGFAGAPFTLASYMIEGGGSRNYALTKQLMFGDRGAWHVLMDKLTHSITMYLLGQVKAGAQCLQLFDSWAGCLSFDDYRQYVLPYVQRIVAAVAPQAPVINFATGNPALLPLLAQTDAAVIGIDWRVRLDNAWETVGQDRAVQGNLDPTVLLTDPDEIRRQAKLVLAQANGRPGHIFNLGHGILPMTPVDNAIALVDAVHELSAR